MEAVLQFSTKTDGGLTWPAWKTKALVTEVVLQPHEGKDYSVSSSDTAWGFCHILGV